MKLELALYQNCGCGLATVGGKKRSVIPCARQQGMVIIFRNKWWILERDTWQTQKSLITFCITAVCAKLHLKRMLKNRPIAANNHTPTVSGRRQPCV